MSWIIIILVWIFKAFVCSLVVFIIDLIRELGKFKHYLFFAFALCFSVFANIQHSEYDILKMFLYVFLEIVGIYFGLFILIAIKNMSGCTMCDKIRAKFRKTK